MNRLGLCGGMLDVDANAHQRMLTPRPVENVFWAKGQAPYGRYTVAVHHFRNWSGQVATPVEQSLGGYVFFLPPDSGAGDRRS